MTLTLDNLMTDLRQTLRVFDQWSVAHATGDGVTTRFKLPDYPVVDADTLFCTMHGDDGVVSTVTAQMYELDTLSGWFSFYEPPAEGQELQWTWQYIAHTDEELLSLVNAGVRYITADIKPEGLIDTSITTDYYTYEYAAPVGAKRLKKVEIRDDEQSPYLRTDYWETVNDHGQLYIKFREDPGVCQVRLFYEGTSTPFTGAQTNGVYTETFPSATGLPDDAYDPVLHYAGWIAMHRAVMARSRDDAAQHQKGEASVTMRDLETRTSGAYTLFQLHLARFASALEMGRIIP